MVKGVVDTVFVFRFVRMLVMRWKDTDAYKYGIIDEDGKVLRKANTLKDTVEKNAYTPFVRLVFNIKRLLEKLPFGKTKLGSFAAALFLIKEQADINGDTLNALLEEMDVSLSMNESTQWFMVGDTLPKGTYKLQENVVSSSTLDVIGAPGDKIQITNPDYIDNILGVNIYEGTCHGQQVFVTQWDIDR